MEHYSYHSIDQFRTAIKTVNDRAKYHGELLPQLVFTGTIKLHGTNASAVLDVASDTVYAQSRNHAITPESDNFGFARYVAENYDFFYEFLDSVRATIEPLEMEILLEKPTATAFAVYGEWFGQGVMGGVAVSSVPKTFAVFAIKVLYAPDPAEGERDTSYWLTQTEIEMIMAKRATFATPANFKSIYDFKTYTIAVDFASPEQVQNQLVELTNKVEECCPVGKAFGIEGIGEGIVWSSNIGVNPERYRNLIFKVKGAKHSDTKTTNLAEVDVEKILKAQDFAAAVCTDHRLEKMVEKIKQDGVEVDVKNTGPFLKAVAHDVMKEEADRLEASGLEWKAVAGQVATVARQWWMKLATGA